MVKPIDDHNDGVEKQTSQPSISAEEIFQAYQSLSKKVQELNKKTYVNSLDNDALNEIKAFVVKVMPQIPKEAFYDNNMLSNDDWKNFFNGLLTVILVILEINKILKGNDDKEKLALVLYLFQNAHQTEDITDIENFKKWLNYFNQAKNLVNASTYLTTKITEDADENQFVSNVKSSLQNANEFVGKDSQIEYMLQNESNVLDKRHMRRKGMTPIESFFHDGLQFIFAKDNMQSYTFFITIVGSEVQDEDAKKTLYDLPFRILNSDDFKKEFIGIVKKVAGDNDLGSIEADFNNSSFVSDSVLAGLDVTSCGLIASLVILFLCPPLAIYVAVGSCVAGISTAVISEMLDIEDVRLDIAKKSSNIFNMNEETTKQTDEETTQNNENTNSLE